MGNGILKLINELTQLRQGFAGQGGLTNYMIAYILIILVVSFILAFRSMKDMEVPPELKHLASIKKFTGRIVFFKDKVKHYSSSSSLKSSG